MEEKNKIKGINILKTFLKYLVPVVVVILLALVVIWFIDKNLIISPDNSGDNKTQTVLTESEISKIMLQPSDKTVIISDSKIKKIMTTPSKTKPNIFSEEQINQIMSQPLK
ncbi:MAG: hypothetical protein IT232_00405 [Flavobacteriales bacterium]|nr:hypothetical protein [Flavobacteriales bacterium]